jgi:DnaJ-class molecular chaperone
MTTLKTLKEFVDHPSEVAYSRNIKMRNLKRKANKPSGQHVCGRCRGSGKVRVPKNTGTGSQLRMCPTCKGTGHTG